jgi:hypothetical protein
MKMQKTLIALAIAGGSMFSGAASAVGYEVWVSDQTNSAGISATNNNGTHGGFLRIFDGAALDLNPNTATSTNLDTALLWPNALANTGSNAIRIHGMIPSPNHNYMAVSFVVSGHLGIVDARTRTAVALFRTTGTANGNLDGAGAPISGSTATGRQNHLTLWSPDGKYMVIANQNGKMLERVNVTWDNSGNITAAVFDAAASLDVVGGTGRITAQPVADPSLPLGTVSGLVADGQSRFGPDGVTYKQHATHRPNNAVICGGMASDNHTTFVTLAGGGLMAVDYTATPMRIVAIWDKAKFSAAGCGAAESGGWTWLNAGVYASNVSSFVLYRMPTNWPSAPAYYPTNLPNPKVIYQDPTQGMTVAPNNAISGNNRDAHGFGLTASRTYLHQFDRVLNNVEVFHAGTGARNTYSLTTAGVCGTTQGANYDSANPTVRVADGHPNAVPVYNDPSPDLLDLSPHGNRFYVALRGPNPLSVAHAAAGSCPGLGIVELSSDGKSGVMTHVIPATWLDNAGTTNIADPHAAIVRLKH